MIVEARRLVCANHDCRAEIIVVKKPVIKTKTYVVHAEASSRRSIIRPRLQLSENYRTIFISSQLEDKPKLVRAFHYSFYATNERCVFAEYQAVKTAY